jgi:hypothetical protein
MSADAKREQVVLADTGGQKEFRFPAVSGSLTSDG